MGKHHDFGLIGPNRGVFFPEMSFLAYTVVAGKSNMSSKGGYGIEHCGRPFAKMAAWISAPCIQPEIIA